MSLFDAAMVLLAAAVATSWAMARHDREHLPVAAFLSLVLGKSCVRMMLMGWSDSNGGQPFEGFPRAALHANQALFVAGPAALAIVSLVVLLGARPWRAATFIAVAWGFCSLTLAAAYPVIRGEPLRLVYLGIELAGMAVAWWSLVRWAVRGAPLSLPVVCVLMLIGIELVSLLCGAWAHGLWGSAWALSLGCYIVLYSLLTILQGGAWILSSGMSSASR